LVVAGPTVVLIVALVVATVWLMFYVGQGGSRLARAGDQAESHQARMDDDSLWKLGLFYVNRDDRAILVEKRFGVGYTLNLGRPLVWWILIGFFVSLTGLTIWLLTGLI
jgi:uncharacterized membrane protein